MAQTDSRRRRLFLRCPVQLDPPAPAGQAAPLGLPGPSGRGALVDAVAVQQDDDDHGAAMAMDVDRSQVARPEQ